MKIFFLLFIIIASYSFSQNVSTWEKYYNDQIQLSFEFPDYCEVTEIITNDSLSLFSINLDYMCYDTVDLKSNYDPNIAWADSSEYLITEIHSEISISVSKLNFLDLTSTFGFIKKDNEWFYQSSYNDELSTVDSFYTNDWICLKTYEPHYSVYLKGGNGCWTTDAEQLINFYYKKFEHQSIYIVSEGCYDILDRIIESMRFVNK